MGLDITWAVDWVRRSADVISEHRVELITLDREIGDGDHGENMDRGFQAVLPKLDDLPAGSTPGDVLKLVATTLISTVGGAAGPLYGTAYLKGAVAAGSETSLDGPAIAAVLTAARDGIVMRGKAESGDKTMVDAWTPAVDAADAAAASGADAAAVLAAAAAAAREGAIATEPLVARKGRASYLGERSAGHRDPGAESTALLLQAAADTASASAGA
ncbi:dihydroxyacetone kinase subunit DhaL [Agromyces sp. NPDC055661]